VGGMIDRENWSSEWNLLQCHFDCHKFHMSWLGLESGPSRWQASN
jgi:hypothetical protein